MSAIRALLLVVLACALVPAMRAPVAVAAGPALELGAGGHGAIAAAPRPCRGKAAGIACGPDLFPAPPASSGVARGRSALIDHDAFIPKGIVPLVNPDPPRRVRAI